MDGFELVLRARRVVVADEVRPAAVAVRDGRIAGVFARDSAVPVAPGGRDVDLGAVALLPGAVDADVRPGGADGLARAAAAAADAGVTTLLALPGPGGAAEAAERARGELRVDVGWCAAVTPDAARADRLTELRAAGAAGFVAHLADLGDGVPPLDDRALRAALRACGALAGPAGRGAAAPLLVHAEEPSELAAPDGPGFSAYARSRPPRAERRAIERVVAAVRGSGGRAHLLRVSAADCAGLLAAAVAAGVRISAQTSAHHLCFPAENVPERATAFATAPPIRPDAARQALWRALFDGVLTGVSAGHAPAPPGARTDDFRTSWRGVASLPYLLPSVWTAARRRGGTLPSLARWLAAEPAAALGLADRGRIAVGLRADLVAFDPEAPAPPVPAGGDPSPYAGHPLIGAVLATWLAGHRADTASGGPPRGRLLTADRAAAPAH
ncbi:amidohydrolase [Allonocardiopsis opalescens]|uniref:Dihydroorotase/allantoinase n=1 Tax=Allonocardiopsis opalescens TaxID=1144618 RepID=A0A2T0Q031_9ACTN|nr:amidohydrolase [Allonocardiopsis opalescens]PRX97159.1 dihydroorotase/allantoinase [Allonocardiopsis opalescens]